MGHGSLPNPYPKFKLSSHIEELETGKVSKLWTNLWDVPHAKTDPIQIAADFYLLQAISAGFLSNAAPPFTDFSEEEIRAAAEALGVVELDEIAARIAYGKQKEEDSFNPIWDVEKKASDMLDDICDQHLDTFRNYLEMTCGGELRHHVGFGGGQGCLHGHRRVAWAGWYYLREEYGLEVLEKAVEYFNDFGGGGYGGPKWATNPKLLLDFYNGDLGKDEKSNRRMFMDRVFTLVHNNGCMLNKLSWSNYRSGYGHDYHLELGMRIVLNAHADDDPKLQVLREFASDDVKNIYDEYEEASGTPISSQNFEFLSEVAPLGGYEESDPDWDEGEDE